MVLRMETLATGQVDSIVAGQPLRLTIVAIDDQLDRTAITYNKAGAKVVTMDSDGNMVASANYWGERCDRIMVTVLPRWMVLAGQLASALFS